MRVLYFGTYSVGPGYPRNTVVVESLRAAGVEVVECRAPLFESAAEKVAAAVSAWGRAKFVARAALAWTRLAARYLTAGPRDVVVVGHFGHVDVLLARALAVLRREPVVLDAFLSPYDTLVGDRKVLAEGTLAARTLFALERAALRVSDRVLTDTAAGADFLARTFAIPRGRFVPIPVGSTVRAPARVPVRVGGAGARRFTALFVGTFLPLHGLGYVLDAALHAGEVDFRLVGDGPEAPEVERTIARRGATNVRLERRFVGREEMEAMLGEADAVLGVFGTGPKTSRVVPCKVYDALAAGRPLVTADTPAAREALGDGANALLVDRGDARALAAALRRLRDEPGLAERLAEGARRLYHRRFSRPALGRRLRRALEEVVS